MLFFQHFLLKNIELKKSVISRVVAKIANVLRMKIQIEKISAIVQTNLIRFRKNVKVVL
jgi:hypothetical protein